LHSAPGTRCHRNGRRRRFHWSLTASVRVWSAGGATLTGQVCYIQIEAWLEHRADKWEPVFRLKRCANKRLERGTCIRSEERRVGEEGGRRGRYGGMAART